MWSYFLGERAAVTKSSPEILHVPAKDFHLLPFILSLWQMSSSAEVKR